MISHEFQPVSTVGGDFLDYFQLLDGRSVFTFACFRKGLPAALYAALAGGTLRGAQNGTSPAMRSPRSTGGLMIRGILGGTQPFNMQCSIRAARTAYR